MGKNEIRLRRQRMTSRGPERYKNYRTVLERHERSLRLKKILRAFLYFAVILFLIILMYWLTLWEISPTTRIILDQPHLEVRT